MVVTRLDIPAELARLLPGSVETSGPLRDVAGFDLGAPLALVRPCDTGEVRALVGWARTARTPLVPFGRRTAYWRPLDFRGAVAVSLECIAHVLVQDDVATIGAGALVRHADDALRARGLALPLVPDGYGDSTVGAMIATGCTAGRGMGNGPIARSLTGLTVVDGNARLLRTGAAAALGLPPFVRDGLPDTTGCFLGSEGCLGIVTEVHLRARPPPHRVLLRFAAPVARTEALLALGRAPLYDTFRASCEDGETWRVELFAQSHASADEAMQRAVGLAAEIARTFGARPWPEPERGEPEWAGPIDGHEAFARSRRLIGLDAVAPYRRGAALAAQLLTLMRRCARAQHRRVALYLAPDFVNAGLHLTYAADDEEGPREAAPFADELHGVVPYRFGRSWAASRADRQELLRLKGLYDPDRLLNPAHPLFQE